MALRRRAGLLVLVATIASTACANDSSKVEDVDVGVEIVDRTRRGLKANTIQWVNGTYGAGCVDRSGAWSLRVSGSAAMTNPALSVVKNDTSCELRPWCRSSAMRLTRPMCP